MNTIKKSLSCLSGMKYIKFSLSYCLGAFMIFAAAFLLLKFPRTAFNGVVNGMKICTENLIPSLYPFMVLCNIYSSLSERKISGKRKGAVDKLSRFVFALPGECISVILFSLFGGLPVGAIMSEKLYIRGVISKEQWRRMLCFCVNPGPAFVISAVGINMIGSDKAGVIIYLSLVFSSLILAFISRFFTYGDDDYSVAEMSFSHSVSNKSAIESAVRESSRALFFICAWVMAFSCLTEYVSGSALPESIKQFISCTAEMTKGCSIASESFSIPVIASVIGFTGFCGHFQLMWAINKAELKYKYFLSVRIINSGLSALICSALLKVFPIAKETFSVGVFPKEKAMSGSVALSVMMLMMSALFVLGDNYKVGRKKFEKSKIFSKNY